MWNDEKWLCTFEISQLGDIIDVQFLGQGLFWNKTNQLWGFY